MSRRLTVVAVLSVWVSWPLAERLWETRKPSAASGPVRLLPWLWVAVTVSVAVSLALEFWVAQPVLLAL